MLTRMMMLVLQKRPRGNQPRAADFLRSRAFDMQMDVCHELFLTDISTWHAAYKAHTQLAPHVFGEAPHSTCIYFYLPRPHLQRLLSKACLSISRPSEVWSMDSRRWVWSLLLPCQQWIHEKNDLFCILLGSSFKKSYTSCVYTDISSKL